MHLDSLHVYRQVNSGLEQYDNMPVNYGKNIIPLVYDPLKQKLVLVKGNRR